MCRPVNACHAVPTKLVRLARSKNTFERTVFIGDCRLGKEMTACTDQQYQDTEPGNHCLSSLYCCTTDLSSDNIEDLVLDHSWSYLGDEGKLPLLHDQYSDNGIDELINAPTPEWHNCDDILSSSRCCTVFHIVDWQSILYNVPRSLQYGCIKNGTFSLHYLVLYFMSKASKVLASL